jgi:hypothetical protein
MDRQSREALLKAYQEACRERILLPGNTTLEEQEARYKWFIKSHERLMISEKFSIVSLSLTLISLCITAYYLWSNLP